jgi:hypothetical protein
MMLWTCSELSCMFSDLDVYVIGSEAEQSQFDALDL